MDETLAGSDAESRTACVLIGRNEGARLRRCLSSVTGLAACTVYVDSGSTDDSLKIARAAGAVVVELDLSTPFTAARARNAGVARLTEEGPFDYIQFVDGDCELRQGWIATATAFLEANPQAAVACGRRRERAPSASVYNRLCDEEWDTPVGQVQACGGDALIRARALGQVGGFNPVLIAGEEPELCVRLRKTGWEIWRLSAEMTWHDAAMTHFGQWWMRARRAGHAYAEGVALHGGSPERHGVKRLVRALLWGLGIPLVALVVTAFHGLWGTGVLVLYLIQVARLVLRRGPPWRVALEHGFFLTLAKFPEALGAFAYCARRLSGGSSRLIEYK